MASKPTKPTSGKKKTDANVDADKPKHGSAQPTQPARVSKTAKAKRAAKKPAKGAATMIVGIGASAGGLQAFRTFFSHMPVDSDLAFVLVQHLAPDHQSMLTELLGRSTQMIVTEATDGTQVEPRHVYVIPPNATLTIDDGVLCVCKPAPPREHRWPINTFFTSLAEDQGDCAVCVVLSGTGSDGAHGLRAIKNHGGLALAQAAFDHEAMTGMPASAVATGLVDAVLPVAEMPARLIAYQKQMRDAHQRKGSDGVMKDVGNYLHTICQLLHTEIGHDFSQYKEKTLMRRIQRRMLVAQTDSVPEYIEYLQNHPKEYELLFREFLIGVTEFFRDPAAFEALQNTAIPSMLADKSGADVLRVWVSGCATGEEAYSIAIALRESMGSQRTPKVQIFATDIDDQAISAARAGRYRAPLIGISPERLDRWFNQDGDDYCVIKQIREMCIFSPHSVIKDPPFSRMDLVSCRNLLIYLNTSLQDQLLRSFHYALRPGGFLLLGNSERLGNNVALFNELDKKQRLYVRRDDGRTHPREFPSAQHHAAAVPRRPSDGSTRESDSALESRAQQALEPWSPAYAVIDVNHEVLRFGGDSSRYLAPSTGAASLNLFQLLDKPLRGIVRAAVLQAFASNEVVIREGLSPPRGGRDVMRLIVHPLKVADNEMACVVAFSEVDFAPRPGSAQAIASDAEPSVRISALEDELHTTRAQLRTAVDLHEIASEELKSANEEYQSVNEELQSANEELETSTEEMQSVNEELQTVNAELHNKNDQLLRVNDDIRNLLDSTRIAVLFLDKDLRIRNYTPAITELFHLREGDKGRPITEISGLLIYPQIGADVERVLREMAISERLVSFADDEKRFLLRMRPYVTVDHVVEGVVLTFVDVTDSQRLNSEHARLAAIVNSSRDAIFGFTLADRITSWNPSAEKIFGLTADDVIGQPLSMLRPASPAAAAASFFDGHNRGQRIPEFDMDWHRADGTRVTLELSYSPIRDEEGVHFAGKLIARDVSERQRAAQHAQMMMTELNHRVKNTLASVQAIAVQSLANAPDMEQFRDSFIARLLALSHTHNLLTASHWNGADLRDIIRSELAPYEQADGDHVRLVGSALVLDAKCALALSMAIHELTTNAAKYGALSVPNGHLQVSWEARKRDGCNYLHMVWTESDGPPVRAGKRRGFGTRLVAEGVAYELGGKVTLDFAPSGVICHFDVPIDHSQQGKV